MSSFFSLNIARRAMQVANKALETTAHNVANTNTPGFSRQRAVIQSTRPHLTAAMNRPAGPGQIGTGVEVSAIIRIRSEMFDLQVRGQNSALGFWNARQDALGYLGGVFMEPSDNGLNTALDQFWSSWHEVTKNPVSEAVRTSLLESANALTSSFHSISVQTNNLLSDLNNQVDLKVLEINNIAENIASLNSEIASARAVGYQPNDLMDKRDMLIDDLSRYTQVSYNNLTTGSINVSISGKVLVQDTKVFKLETQVQGNGQSVAVWQRDSNPLAPNQGELAGIADLYNFISSDMLGGLNQLARELAEAVNDLHNTGFDLTGAPGQDFFDIPGFAVGQEASYISLSSFMMGNPQSVAASSDPAVQGNNDIAMALAELRNETPMSGGLTSFKNYFNSLVTNLGFETQTSNRMTQNHEVMLEHAEARRQSESGVSIDEEITHMLQFQHSYQAAAKLISTIDSLLGTLINEMGRR